MLLTSHFKFKRNSAPKKRIPHTVWQATSASQNILASAGEILIAPEPCRSKTFS